MLLFGGAIACYADTVVVSILGSYEVRSLNLKENDKAKLEVFLQSFGEPLEGYVVALYRDQDKKELKRIITDASGELYFKGLSAGNYTVALIKPKRVIKQGSMVKIGDIRLTILED